MNGRPAGEEEDGVFFLFDQIKESLGSLLDETTNATDLMECEWHNKKHGEVEDDELEHVGHEHSPKATDHGVEDHDRAEDENGVAQ